MHSYVDCGILAGYIRYRTENSENKPRGVYFSKPLLEGQRGLYTARVILGRKFASSNRLGSGFEDVDLSKTQPCTYLVYMDRGNPSQE